MRILLVMALSTALTGSLFLTQNVVAHLGRSSDAGILERSHFYDTTVQKLQTYTGVYEFPQIGLNFRIWLEDGALRVQSVNRPGLVSTLRPTGDDHFISHEGGDVECWFDRKAGTLTFTQRGRTFTGKRK